MPELTAEQHEQLLRDDLSRYGLTPEDLNLSPDQVTGIDYSPIRLKLTINDGRTCRIASGIVGGGTYLEWKLP